MRDAYRSGERSNGGSGTSPVVLGLVIAAAGLSVILLIAWYTLAGRVRAVERGGGSRARDARILDQLSARVDRLSDRVKAGEEDRLSSRSLEARLADLGNQIADLQRGDDRRKLAMAVEELKGMVGSLQTEIKEARRLALEAAQRELPAPAAVAAGADPQDLARLSTRVVAVEERLTELANRPRTPSTGTTPRINEEALRKLIRKEVQDGLPEAMRDMWRRRRPEGGGGRRPGQ